LRVSGTNLRQGVVVQQVKTFLVDFPPLANLGRVWCMLPPTGQNRDAYRKTAHDPVIKQEGHKEFKLNKFSCYVYGRLEEDTRQPR